MDTDAHLAVRLAADLDRAFPALVADHTNRLYTIALRLLGDPRDAEEVAQDALVRAYRAIAGYPPERTTELRLRPWLASIAINLAHNRRRRHDDRRPPEQLEPLVEGGYDPADHAALTGPEAASRRESIAELAALLLELPPAVRAAIILRHVDGLSVAETAEALRRPEGTVKAQVARGLERMRARIAAGAADEPGAAGGAGSRHSTSSLQAIDGGRTFAAAEVPA
jgi:RNA polymerase sigma factor (sigma-70 family)